MPRPSKNGLSIADLERLLEKRRREQEELTHRREKLQAQLDEMDKHIRSLGGSSGAVTHVAAAKAVVKAAPGKKRGRRGRNARSLIETMQDALGSAGGPLSVGDIVERVKSSGYHSSSANFRGIVNQTLIKERKKFANVGRGMYQLSK